MMVKTIHPTKNTPKHFIKRNGRMSYGYSDDDIERDYREERIKNGTITPKNTKWRIIRTRAPIPLREEFSSDEEESGELEKLEDKKEELSDGELTDMELSDRELTEDEERGNNVDLEDD